MARPNLSVSCTSLVVSRGRWSTSQFCHSEPSGAEGERGICFCHNLNGHNGKKHTSGHVLASVSFPMASLRSREAWAFPPKPLGDRVPRAPSPACHLHRRLSQGMPGGQGGRKLNIIIDASEDVRSYLGDDSSRIHGCVARLFSIAASASGAITLKPAAFGCSPSSLKSFFNIPLSSTIALK